MSIEHEFYRINYSLLDVLDNNQQIEEGIVAAMRLSGGVLNSSAVTQISEVLHMAMPEINVEKMITWPRLDGLSGSMVGTGLKLLPVAGWAVVKRSRGSSGVLDELQHLADLDASEWSQALNHLLRSDSTMQNESDDEISPAIAPARLSGNQEHLLRSSRKHGLTICHGPPGTGKSYTIANMAIDHITRGHSVLIVSKKDHAVDVIHSILTDLLGAAESMVRVGRSHYLRDFKARLSGVLSSRGIDDLVNDKELTDQFKQILKRIKQLEAEFNKLCDQSLHRSELLVNPSLKWYQKILKRWYMRAAAKRPLLLDFAQQIDQQYILRDQMVKELIARRTELRINEAMTESRDDIKNLLKGLRKRKSSDQLKAFSEVDFTAVLKIFPIWMTSLSDLHRVLPFEKEIFDIVIIDEASQCDIASALPAIQRAKRVVIAGDAKQLRHVSFVSKNMMSKLADDIGLSATAQAAYNYRSVSLMDLAIEHTQHSKQVASLNEHFRSLASIIHFSNQHFYNNELLVMRERLWEKESIIGVHIEYCEGVRSEAGINHKEVEAVIGKLDELIKKELRSEHAATSIGILSPFRSQVDALTKHVSAYAQKSGYVHRLAKHQVKVGTAHSFQGEERDVMLISLAIGYSDNSGVRRFLEKEDVFNVSITRAKEKQFIFCSIEAKDLPASSLLASYLNSIQSYQHQHLAENHPLKTIDTFARELADSCVRLGIGNKFNQSVAGIPIDILLEKDGLNFGIDLIGYPGYSRDAIGISKQQILDRVGFKLVPIDYVEWQVNRERVMSRIVELLKLC